MVSSLLKSMTEFVLFWRLQSVLIILPYLRGQPAFVGAGYRNLTTSLHSTRTLTDEVVEPLQSSEQESITTTWFLRIFSSLSAGIYLTLSVIPLTIAAWKCQNVHALLARNAVYVQGRPRPIPKLTILHKDLSQLTEINIGILKLKQNVGSNQA